MTQMRRSNSVRIDLVGVRSARIANGSTTRERAAEIGVVIIVSRVISHADVCSRGTGNYNMERKKK